MAVFTGVESVGGAIVERNTILARLRERINTTRTRQAEWSGQFTKLYRDAVDQNFNAPFLVQWAAALLEKQRDALEQLYPSIQNLQRNLARYQAINDMEMEQLCEETIDLLFGWVAPYRDLSGKLLDLAAERRATVATVLRARPVKGNIDYAELSREHIARYPKIRARLAK